MSVTATVPHIDVAADGSTTNFPFAFVCYTSTEIVVQTIDSSTTPPTVVNPVSSGITITGTAGNSDWNIAFTSAPNSTTRVVADRIVPLSHTYQYTADTTLPSPQVTSDLDHAAMQSQQQQQQLNRSFQFSSQEPTTTNNVITALAAARAGLILGFDSNGNLVLTSPSTGTPTLGTGSVSLTNIVALNDQTFIGNNSGSTTNPQPLTVSAVKSMLAINNVTNTSDANKPVSTAQQTAINAVIASSLQASNNLSDVSSASSARTNLSVSSTAQMNTAIGAAQGYGFNNCLINGNFDIWQRGTSFSNPGYSVAGLYTADRWCGSRYSNANNITLSQVSASGAGNGAYFGLKVQRTAGDTQGNTIQIAQIIDSADIKPLLGKTAYFSLWAKAGANLSGTLNAFIQWGNGTSTNPISNGTGWTAGGGVIISGTTWTQYTISFSIPSNASNVAVMLIYTPSGTAGADDSFTIAQADLRAGNAMVNYEFRPRQVELALCQRFFCQVGGTDPYEFFGMGQGTASNTFNATVALPVPMRTTPTLVSANLANMLVQQTYGSSNHAPSAIAIGTGSGSAKQRIVVTEGSGSVVVANECYCLLANNSTNPYLQFSSEL